jgi:PIN domain nuclease of toxin-antitoxin system
MNLLLDTQVLIWSLAADRRLKSTPRRAIEDGSNRVLVSAASAWEIEIKTALGKLKVPDDLLTQLAAVKFEELPVRIEHALCLRRLPALHRDPFDRILVAQALCEGLTLVTADPILGGYPVRIIRAD